MNGSSRSNNRAGSGAEPKATSRHWSSAFSTRTAQCLSSGWRDDEARAPIRGRKYAVLVQTRLPFAGVRGERPLLRTAFVEQRVGKTGDVEIAAARRLAVLIEDVFRRPVGKQSLPAQATRHVDGDFPVAARLAWRRHGGAYARDAALRVRHRALLLAPAGGGQEDVRIARRFGVAIGVL